MDFTVKRFSQLETAELYELLKARFSVFVMEQHCFYLDMDDTDYESIHVFSQDGGKVSTYARIYPEETPGVWHVGRVLTMERGKGHGLEIMEKVIEVVKDLGASKLRLDAQCQAKGFYGKLGFTTCSGEFMEAGIPHIMMEMDFKKKTDIL